MTGRVQDRVIVVTGAAGGRASSFGIGTVHADPSVFVACRLPWRST